MNWTRNGLLNYSSRKISLSDWTTKWVCCKKLTWVEKILSTRIGSRVRSKLIGHKSTQGADYRGLNSMDNTNITTIWIQIIIVETAQPKQITSAVALQLHLLSICVVQKKQLSQVSAKKHSKHSKHPHSNLDEVTINRKNDILV